MRWTSPKLGDKRIRSRFLIFPKRLQSQWRWLEYACWEEEYQYVSYSFHYDGKWQGRRWLNDPINNDAPAGPAQQGDPPDEE